MQKVNIIWLRRDLRLSDNAALYHALNSALPVLPIFIFDKNILDKLEDKTDARVSFIHDVITNISNELQLIGSTIKCYYGKPTEIFEKISTLFQIETVFTNHDYEKYALIRDEEIKESLAKKNIEFKTFKDQVIFEKLEVTKDDGLPYTVFTPYSKKWKLKFIEQMVKPFPTEKYFKNFYQCKNETIISLMEMGFKKSELQIPSSLVDENIVKNYTKLRDYPAMDNTTRMGLHLRFGTISIRQLCKQTKDINETYLNELIWRDFYHQILFNFPHISEGKAFRKEYDKIPWSNNTHFFEKWCEGKTGYPLVDAGMRELNATGFMHNRVRMVVASFLSKHLLLDWRLGEAYFAQKLLDFDFAANNGGWQWAAGCGCDAAPYFRVFSPKLQLEKFDKELKYVKKWVPEYETINYVKPIVVHEDARKLAIETYSKVLKKV